MRVTKLRNRYNSWEDAVRDIATILNEEPTFTVTLSSGTASTSVSNSLAGSSSVISFMPTTANAATDMSSLYVSARNKGSFIITHANNGNGDRTFAYSISG